MSYQVITVRVRFFFLVVLAAGAETCPFWPRGRPFYCRTACRPGRIVVGRWLWKPAACAKTSVLESAALGARIRTSQIPSFVPKARWRSLAARTAIWKPRALSSTRWRSLVFRRRALSARATSSPMAPTPPLRRRWFESLIVTFSWAIARRTSRPEQPIAAAALRTAASAIACRQHGLRMRRRNFLRTIGRGWSGRRGGSNCILAATALRWCMAASIRSISSFSRRPTPQSKKQALDKTGLDGVIGGHCGLPFTQTIGARLWAQCGSDRYARQPRHGAYLVQYFPS